jgi:hypothetical protein
MLGMLFAFRFRFLCLNHKDWNHNCTSRFLLL